MTTINNIEISDAEVLAILNRCLKNVEPNPEKEAKKAARKAAKRAQLEADFQECINFCERVRVR
jgi:hypothetical protein